MRPQISSVQKAKLQPERRRFLREAGGVALGALAVGVLPKSVRADENTQQRIFMPLVQAQPSQVDNKSKLEFGLVSSEEVQFFLKKAQEENALRIFQDKLTSEYSSLRLLLHKYQMFVVDEKTVIVNFEVESPTGYSSFELLYDKITGALAETRSFLAEYDESRNIMVHTYTNNQLVTNVSVTEDGQFLSGALVTSDGRIISSNEVNAAAVDAICGCWSACVLSFGVPGWVLSALAAVCGLVCACSAGVGCVVCASAVVYGFYLIFAGCALRCWGFV